MRNRMYGGVRGRKTKVGEKLLRFPPTRSLSGRVGKSLRANLLVHLTGRIRINPCLKTTRLLVLLPTLNLQVVLRECAESLDEGGG